MRSESRCLALVPLDARPCTARFPAAIGRMGSCDVVVPPADLLGDLYRPAPVDDLFDWLDAVAPHVDAAVLALDTLIYGGLIPARRGPEPIDTLLGRLARVRDLPIGEIYAFGVTLRISNSDVAEEEKPYWAEFGPAIHRWSFFSDKYDVTRDPAAADQARFARALVPDAVAQDYLATRRRNYSVNLEELELAEQGRFKLLCLTQDDTSPFGFNQAERRHIEARAQPNVLVYPGADEVATTLVGRYLNDRDGRVPVFRLHVFPAAGGDLVAMYEDRPLRLTVAGQVRAVGGFLDAAAGESAAANAEPAGARAPAIDLVLNAPGGGQGDLALRVHLDRVDSPARDLDAICERLAVAPAPALADVAYANGADPALWERLAGSVAPERMAGFAAWNTAGNTIGTVAALASAYLTGPADPAAHRSFLMERLADDYLYQSLLRPRLQREGRPIPELERELGRRLTALWQERFGHLPIRAIQASLPWGRLFEADIRVEE